MWLDTSPAGSGNLPGFTWRVGQVPGRAMLPLTHANTQGTPTLLKGVLAPKAGPGLGDQQYEAGQFPGGPLLLLSRASLMPASGV